MPGLKILFITAPYHAGVVEIAGRWVPLYMVTLAGSARAAGHRPVIYDAMTKGVGMGEIEAKIREEAPDVVAVSAITATSVDALEVVGLAKRLDPNIVTVAGGIHSTFMYEQMFERQPGLDHVVVGEGEASLVDLLDALQAGRDVSSVRGLATRRPEGILKTASRALIRDLDTLPFAWDLLDWSDYTYFILPGSTLGAIDTSRGCEKGCTFCSQQKFWARSWRPRSPEAIVREMEYMRDQHGVSVVLFTDDYPTPDRARWERLLDLLIERETGLYILMETRATDIVRDADILHRYRKAGIIHIYIGTESTDQKTLDLIDKELSVDESRRALALCRQHDIITETSMILGFPDDTQESISRTIDQVIDYDPDFAHFLAIAPWPYADIAKDLAPYVEEHDYRRYNLIDPVIKPIAMTRKQVDAAIVEGYRRFYMGKFKEMLSSKDPFKRQYMLNAMRRMMTNSFIRDKIGNLGAGMPPEIARMVFGR